jgi:hypothetical protein
VMAGILSAIAWDPQIQGVMVVVVMVVLLMGSVYLILATNLATRLGFLVALTGLFGWMTLNGGVWWIYAQGWQGDAGAWEVTEINTGDLAVAELEQAQRLAGIEDRLDDLPLPEDAERLDDATPEEFDETVEPLSDELDGWRLLHPSHGDRGEAGPVVEAALTGADYPSFSSPDDYVEIYAMSYGGKPERQSDGAFDRAANQVTNTLRVTHPPHYMVVLVRPGEPEVEAVPGEPPPAIVPVDDSEVVAVLMERDLGNVRLPAFMTMVVSGVLFATCCYMLHVRDRTLMQNRSAPLPEPVAAGKA